MRSAARLAIAIVLAGLAAHAGADEARSRAIEHYRAGSRFFDLGHYEEAAVEYELAYQAKEKPELLYNLGQAYRLGGHPQKALVAYRSYLHHAPNASNRDEVVGFIDMLKQTIEAQKQAAEKPPTSTLTEAPSPRPTPPPAPAVVTPPQPPKPLAPPPDPRQLALGKKLRVAGIGLGAVGVAGLIVGGVFAGLTSSVSHQLSNPSTANGPATYSKSLESKGRADEAVEIAGFAVGGVALAGGIAALVVGQRKVERNRPMLAPAVGPGHVGVTLTGAF